MYGGALVSWKSKKQTTTARSSVEVDQFRSMASVVAELTWLKGLFEELSVKLSLQIHLFCDSKAAIQIAANPIFLEHTKHIDIDCYFI